jgi:hypothetical protein
MTDKTLGQILVEKSREVQNRIYGYSESPWEELSESEKASVEECAQSVRAHVLKSEPVKELYELFDDLFSYAYPEIEREIRNWELVRPERSANAKKCKERVVALLASYEEGVK